MPDEETDTKDMDDDSDGSSDSDNREGDEQPRKGKKRKQELTEDEKKAERRAANRRSAFQSRQRRKVLIEDLQKTVSDLSKENSSLRSENEALRLQLDASVRENRAYRLQQQLSASNTGAGGYPGVAAAAALMAQTGLTQAQLLGAQGLGLTNPGAGASADQLLSTRLALSGLSDINSVQRMQQGLPGHAGLAGLNDPLQRVNLGFRGNLGGLDQGMQGGVNHLLRRAEENRSRSRDSKAQDSD